MTVTTAAASPRSLAASSAAKVRTAPPKVAPARSREDVEDTAADRGALPAVPLEQAHLDALVSLVASTRCARLVTSARRQPCPTVPSSAPDGSI